VQKIEDTDLREVESKDNPVNQEGNSEKKYNKSFDDKPWDSLESAKLLDGLRLDFNIFSLTDFHLFLN
jgi:hypothetical protein